MNDAVTLVTILPWITLACAGIAAAMLFRGNRLAFCEWMLAAWAMAGAQGEILKRKQAAEIVRLTERVEVLENTCKESSWTGR